jgi:hypothetical protein
MGEKVETIYFYREEEHQLVMFPKLRPLALLSGYVYSQTEDVRLVRKLAIM